eukprot:CAMPEP_0183333264 /NCGR_PEP_ID=MMETSP0164_2-20130417/2209_1 /TAXON_ID=221442 /ORGANISM="Coccolithus pelagicus ssp braarudi, Strain PLY182g" /LENGTH=321 /DNA_ID=CAMNT_0025502157 /DNA_START=27 /DNA_END=992 /DNA_ORIENTATION=-
MSPLLRCSCALLVAQAATAFHTPALGSPQAHIAPRLALSPPAVVLHAIHGQKTPRTRAICMRGDSSAEQPQCMTVPFATVRSVFTKLLFVVVTTMLTLACFATRALAAERTAMLGVPIPGGVVKWGALGAFVGVLKLAQTKEDPIIEYVETTEEANAQSAAGTSQLQTAATDTTRDDAAATSRTSLTAEDDDSAFLGSLRARMVQLHEESAKDEEGADADATPKDSTGGWGAGSTAVLEPPRPSTDDDSADTWGTGSTAVLEPERDSSSLRETDGAEKLKFPPGFPLRDGDVEVVEPQPAAASESQIAMLERMFGVAPDES